MKNGADLAAPDHAIIPSPTGEVKPILVQVLALSASISAAVEGYVQAAGRRLKNNLQNGLVLGSRTWYNGTVRLGRPSHFFT